MSRRARLGVLCALAASAAGCMPNISYAPEPKVTAAPARDSAAITVIDLTPAGDPRPLLLAGNWKDLPWGAEDFTAVAIKDLEASGLFKSVGGADQNARADVSITVRLLYKSVEQDTKFWWIGADVQVDKGGALLYKKTYRTKLGTLPHGKGGKFLARFMHAFRTDLAAALAGQTIK